MRPKFNIILSTKVGAGFTPARDSNLGDLRAGMNPAPTSNRERSIRTMAPDFLAITSGTQQ
jgi:hypothetical protein